MQKFSTLGIRARSSVAERLHHTQEVVGSNPIEPTMKFVLLFLALLTVIGVGVWVLTGQQESTPGTNIQTESNENEKDKAFQVSEQLARSVIHNTLDERFDKQTATYNVANLDGQDGPELIIGAAGNNIATILITSILDSTGTSERLGNVDYQEVLRGVPEVRDLQDITGDGKDELFVSLGYGGASNDAYGFLQADMQGKKLEWIQLRDPDNQIRDAIFLMGGTVTHAETVQIIDVNSDGKKEIVELFSQIWEFENGKDTVPSKQAGEVWCLARVYQWNGSLFTFNRALSEQFLESLGSNCAI